MPVFLEVQSGAQTGKRIQLEPGRMLRVGRTERADLVFPDDTHMSGLHFSLGWEGSECRLTDLNSRNGVSVNGQTTASGLLRDGDLIAAGNTRFALRVVPDEPATVASDFAALAVPAVTTARERLLPLMRRELQPLYVILDAARDVRILALMVTYKEECQSLYEGQQGAELAQVAPYLVRLTPESKLLEALIKEGWGKSWGVYFTCASEFQQVRHHLRHFLQVKLPDGEQVYFRFYDPRVMRIFLPTCVPHEATQFFGPIKRYVLEGEDPNELWEFTTLGRGTEKRVLSLAQPAQREARAASVQAVTEPRPIIENPGPEGQR